VTEAAKHASHPASQPAPDVAILSSFVSHDEAAAIIAVVGTAHVAETADDRGSIPVPSAWVRSQRSSAAPFAPGRTKWRSFAG